MRRFIVVLLAFVSLMPVSAQDGGGAPEVGHIAPPPEVSAFLSEVFEAQMTGCGVYLQYWYEVYQYMMEGEAEPTTELGFLIFVDFERDCGSLPDSTAAQAWFEAEFSESAKCGWEIVEFYDPITETTYGLKMHSACWLAGPDPAEVESVPASDRNRQL